MSVQGRTIISSEKELRILCEGFMIGNEDEAMKRYIDFKSWCEKHVDFLMINEKQVHKVINREVYSPQFKYGDDEAIRRYKI